MELGKKESERGGCCRGWKGPCDGEAVVGVNRLVRFVCTQVSLVKGSGSVVSCKSDKGNEMVRMAV